MTSKDQKQREQDQVMGFLGAHESPPEGTLTRSETPDFLVNDLGIELTEIYQGGSGRHGATSRRRDTVYEQICGRARDAYPAASPAVRVSVDFRDGYLPGKGDIQGIADALTRIVESNPLSPGDSVTLYQDDLPEPLTRVAIRSAVASHPDVARWEPSGVGMVQNQISNEIQQALDGKNSKAESCRQKASEVWIVLVIPADGPATYMAPDDPTLTVTYASEFDRTFVFDAAYGRTWELQTH